MTRSFGRTAASALLLTALAAPAAAQTAGEVLDQARRAYYSLEGRGLASFQCRALPNWEMLLAEVRKTDPAQAERARASFQLAQLVVTVAVGKSTQVTHGALPGVSPQEAPALQQVQQILGQVVSGFFDSWSPFVLTSVLPPRNDGVDLKEQADQYTLAYSEGAARFFILMTKDYAIRSLRMESPGASGTFRPQFAPTPDGLLLTSYQADISGPQPGGMASTQVTVFYQDVAGFQIPRTLSISGTQSGAYYQIDVEFTDCQVTRR